MFQSSNEPVFIPFLIYTMQDLLKRIPSIFFKAGRFFFSQHLKIKTPISPPAARNEACFEVVLATYGRYLFLMTGFILKSQLLPQNSAGQTANFNQSRELLNSFFVFLEEMFKFWIWIIFSLVTLLNTNNIHWKLLIGRLFSFSKWSLSRWHDIFWGVCFRFLILCFLWWDAMKQNCMWYISYSITELPPTSYSTGISGYNIHIPSLEPKWPLFWLKRGLLSRIDLQK